METNVHKLNLREAVAIVIDESSILKTLLFTGIQKTQQSIMTPSPNEPVPFSCNE